VKNRRWLKQLTWPISRGRAHLALQGWGCARDLGKQLGPPTTWRIRRRPSHLEHIFFFLPFLLYFYIFVLSYFCSRDGAADHENCRLHVYLHHGGGYKWLVSFISLTFWKSGTTAYMHVYIGRALSLIGMSRWNEWGVIGVLPLDGVYPAGRTSI
jgi:hypothetical protein